MKLCRIARKWTLDEVKGPGDDRSFIFEFKNYKWCLEDNLYQYAEAIHEFLDLLKALNLLRFGVVEQNHLNIVFMEGESKSVPSDYEINSILCELFTIIFTNYQAKNDLYLQFLQDEFKALASDVTGSTTKLVKSYCTTQLYDALFEAHKSALPPEENIPSLELPAHFSPTLYTFQKRTVHWLLQQEQEKKYLPNFWIELLPRTGVNGVNLAENLYKHKYCLLVETTAPEAIELPQGGILADEMGLGKTVEILALITLNPRSIDYELLVCRLLELKKGRAKNKINKLYCICQKKTIQKKIQTVECSRCHLLQHVNCVKKSVDSRLSAPYVCPACWHELTANNPLACRATVIVTPQSIRTQWLSEVKRHAPAMRVFSYDSQTWISPSELGEYDLVITDYTVLRKEFYHTDKFVSTRKTRYPPRSMRRFTPLLMLQWYRVCLDEAQMIDSNLSMAAELVGKLPAVHRWAITGTPISYSIDDLKPLLEFIGVRQICSPLTVWNTLTKLFLLSCNNSEDQNSKMNRAQQPLIECLQTCMWRTCKKNIASEWQIPPQEERVHHINFMDLEKLHYMEQHASEESEFNRGVSKHSSGNKWHLRTISPQILKIILKPFHKIRQCCTIPTTNFKNGNITGLAHTQRYMQPSELMEHMKSVNDKECKGALRTMASSYNGLAAIQFIKGNYAKAITYYERVLNLSHDLKCSTISVDSLLQIHAIHNLLEANKILVQETKKTELDAEMVEKYKTQYSNMEQKYLQSYKEQLYNVKNDYDKAICVLKKNNENKILKDVGHLLDDLDAELSNTLFQKIYYDCRSTYSNAEKYENMQSFGGLLLLLQCWLDKLVSKRKQLVKTLKTLDFLTENIKDPNSASMENFDKIMKLARSVYDCHLSEIRVEKVDPPPNKKIKKNKCILCECGRILNAFYCLVYDQEMDDEDDAGKGTQRSAVEIYILRMIFNFLRSKCKTEMKETVSTNLEILDALQNFYQRTSKFWIEVEYTVKAYDELDMCKMRVSIAENEQKKSNYLLLPNEIDDFNQTQEIQLNDSQLLFSRKIARRKYLQHLGDNIDHGPCPVCCSELHVRYAVLECGHHLCVECLKHIKQSTKLNSIDCMLCRNKQLANNVYYVTKCVVNLNSNMSDDTANIETKGVFSSKITYILRVLLKLRQMDENVKVLIFSKWQPMLTSIAEALKLNDISHCMHKDVKNFKNPKSNIMCLLMPLNNGSKGLNLIEATHVFLLEPILNPGEEQQALGRVHRLGQTKPTMVHRFIVSNTIEENIYNVTSKKKNSHANNWEFKDMTLHDIEQLFVLKNEVSDHQL